MSKLTRLFCLSLLLALAAATTAAAQEGVVLGFKFAPGDVQEYEMSFSGSGGLRAPDGEMAAMGMQGSCRAQVTVGEVLPDGSARLALLLQRAEVQMTIGEDRARFSFANGQVRWYANGREQAPPEADIAQMPMLGVPLEFIASPRGQILDVILPNLQSMAGMQQMVPGLGPPQLKNLGAPLFPDKPVRVGETWRRSVSVMPFGPTMPVTVTTSRTLDSYSGVEAMGLAKISGYSETTFRANPMTVGPSESQMTVSMPEMKQTLTSTEFFNVTEGRLVRADYISSLTTRVAFAAGEQGQQEAGLEARFSATIQAR